MPAYAAEVLADSPLGYWRLGEAAGATTLVDSSPNGRNGSYVPSKPASATSLLSGDPDPAVAWSGNAAVSGAYAQVPFGTWLNTSSITLEAWVTVPTNVDMYPAIMDRDMSGGRRFQWRISNTRKLEFLFWTVASGGSPITCAGATTLVAGTSYHLAATYDHTTGVARVYVNKVQDGTVTTTASALSSAGSTPLRIGAGFAGDTGVSVYQRWTGTEDECAYYGTALSATRIAAHYDGRSVSPAPPSSGVVISGSGESGAAVVATTVAGPYSTSAEASGESDATLTASVAGATTEADFNGSGTSDAQVEVTLFGAGVGFGLTDTSNRVGGRRRRGEGTATWTPAVVPTPPNLPAAQVFDVAHAFSTVTVDGTMPRYSVTTARAARPRPRIVIGGRDVTYFRGVPLPEPSYQLVEPLLYGTATIEVPQVAPCFERLGVGDLKWVRPGAPVLIQRVNAAGAVVATDYKGVVIGFNADGGSLTLEVGGEATGRAALRNWQIPLWSRRQDLGRQGFNAINALGLPFKPRLGPTTGILVKTFGGMGHLDYIQQVCARAWTRDGAQWTIMPGEDGAYRMARKDTTTIHGTVYLDDSRVVGSLRRDIAEEPNRIYGTGVAPSGMRVKNGSYPGLLQGQAAPYPMTDGSPFGVGTTDADTDAGDGVFVMINRLDVTNYLAREDTFDGYTSKVARAIRNLQDDAGLTETGTMDPATWAALWDLSVTGYTLGWSSIQPMAQRRSVNPWRRSSTGAIIGRNPAYNPSVLKVDRNIDFGTGFTRGDMREWSRAELEREDNWVGTITISANPPGMYAIITGEHNPGDPLTEADVLPARDIRPGMNLWAPLFDGGTLFHVSAVDVSSEQVTLVVDTRARDAMEVWQVIQRNRETRSDPARMWMQEHRASTMRKDSVTEFDEVGGVITRVEIPANTWTVFPVVAGGEGTIRSLRVNTNPNAEFVMAVFGREIPTRRLNTLVGNPLTAAGSKRWTRESVRDALDDRFVLLYVAGDDAEPLGYYPKTKTAKDDDDTSPAPLTGRWEDDAGFSYHAFAEPVLWVAVYADRDTAIPAGRIMWPQLEAGA